MSTMLQSVIVAHRCRSTHHFMAMEALNLLEGPDAPAWRDLLLVEHLHLLRGAKAPDAEFKDFKNHVLHIGEGEWGGARDAAMEWYGRAVEALREKDWREGAFALGVLSHYYADPIQPFHTGQTEEEGSIHRALEWSIAKSRTEITRRIEAAGYPDITPGDGPGFVSDMVRAGAERSHPHYQTFIDHYDVHAGVKDPPAGLDETLLTAIADLCAYATKGIAVLYSRAIEEAGVAPKKVHLTLHGYLSTLDIPIRWVARKIDDVGTRNTVMAMYKELKKTGKVIDTLPEDDKEIRKLHARDVQRIPLKELDERPAKPTGSKHVPLAKVEPKRPKREAPKPEMKAAEIPKPAPKPEPAPVVEAEENPVAEIAPDPTPEPTPAPAPEPQSESEPTRPRLTRESGVEAAPSIGKKTAARLNRIGIRTVGDLLDADPEETASSLAVRFIPTQQVIDWQDQTKLQMALPGLRVHDVQILVGAEIRTVDDLAAASAGELLEAAVSFVKTPSAKRIISEKDRPDAEEVDQWISLAQSADAASA